MKHRNHAAIRTAIDAIGPDEFARVNQLSKRTVERLYGGGMPDLAAKLVDPPTTHIMRLAGDDSYCGQVGTFEFVTEVAVIPPSTVKRMGRPWSIKDTKDTDQ